ncbi:MAG: histidinol-phosphate aminotransferase family protein [Butyrivibrio sp.]|nr:histidinol-phosphate aminotransferase family protein [Butyrivibrio sp.]
MNTEEIFSRSVLEKPESQRASRSNASLDLTRLMRLGWNENPYGMAPEVLKTIQEAARKGHLYQDFWCRDVKKAIADFYGMTPENVIMGAGSSPLIEMTGQAFINPGDEVLMCPTFAAFNDMTEVRLGRVVTVPLKENKGYDLNGLLKAVTPRTKMVVICNPNNPTGQYIPYEEIVSFMEKLPEDIVVFFDEAYIEFATAPDCRSAVPLISQMPDKPIIVSRTFSKYYGMAGVRCGYLLCSRELAAGISRIPGSWVSRDAQAGAVAALKEQKYYQSTKKQIVEGVAYLERELAALGCTVYHTQTNFIMFDPHIDCEKVREEIIERGILISIPMLCRVSVGTETENEYFIQCMKDILKNAAVA